MVTLDSSGLFELLDRAAPNHGRAVEALRGHRPPFVIPASILGELGCMVEARLGHRALDALLDDLESGAYTLDCGERDFGRIRHLLTRYADLSLGFSDAAVIACAERNGGAVLTFDLRDFGPVSREGTLTLAPGP